MPETTGKIDTNDFLKFFFSTLFLFACCLSLILYIPTAIGVVVSFLLQYFILPKNTIFSLGSVQISPLQARLFFKDLNYQNENVSLRIVDGYFTFNFWGYWFQSPNWTTVTDYMIKDTLVGTRCRARANFKFAKGTIVGIEPDKKRVYVQLDPNVAESGVLSEEEEEGDGDADGQSLSQELLSGRRDDTDAVTMDSFPSEEVNRPFDLSDPGAVRLGAASSGPAKDLSASRRDKDSWTMRVPVMEAHTLPSTTARPAGGTGRSATATNINNNNNLNNSGAADANARSASRGDEIVKLFDANDVRIRSKPGLCQLHVNGTRLCVFNATGKYKDLLNGEPYASAGTAGGSGSGNSPNSNGDGGNRKGTGGSGGGQRGHNHNHNHNTTNSSGSTGATEESGGKRAGKRLLNALKGKLKESPELDETAQTSHRAAGVEAAKKLQRHQLENKSFLQRFFAFIGAVEAEMFATTIDIGGVNAPHPYFLHITALRGEGRVFLTRDSVCPIDLYRMVLDFTLQQVDMRMAQMDSKLTESQVLRNPSLRDRAQLMFKGTASRLTGTDEVFAAGAASGGVSSDLIRDFGILVDGKDKGNVHILVYRDAPNVYAGEEIRRDALPRQGVEVMIDTPNFRYGPWLEYCRFQMWQYFLPPNFRPLSAQAPVFTVGQPRPVPGIEFFVEFMRETRFEIPFKRRAVAPSPPFGIRDSHEKGVLTATIGAGSQFIQKGFFILPGEEKQNYEALFMGKNVTVWSNCVLGRETIFCHADSVQFFLDRQDDMMWNGRKLWNILPKISGAEVYFFMLYVDFFLDLLNDWQFAQNMYHNVPLTTEAFNTYERAVRDFIPNVKRFEVFLDGFATVYINVNHHNVVYAQDPCDLTKNVFAILKVQQGNFSMVLPSDQYQLSYENEVVRPLKVAAKELKAYVSLPPTHPLYDQVSMEIPFAYCEHAEIDGSFIINVGNQSIPQDKEPVVRETGRTKHTNFLNLQLDFTNMHGTLMGPHIKGLIDCFENIFLDNTMTITPDELFWLLAKLQSHVTTGKNKRKELKQYLESKAPVGNDLEISVLVRITDLEATAATSQAKGAPGVLLTTSQLTFTYLKQFACTDTCVVLAPIVARFCDAQGRIPRGGSMGNFLSVGCIRVGLLKHFGRMPLKPKVHEAMDVFVDGVSFDIDMEHLVVLTDVVRTLLSHLLTEDSAWEAEVEEARAIAEYAAEQIWRGPQRRQAAMAASQWRAQRAAAPDAMWNFYHNNNQINMDDRITKQRLAERSRRGAEFYYYDGSPPDWQEGEMQQQQHSGGGGGGGAAQGQQDPHPLPYQGSWSYYSYNGTEGGNPASGRTVLTGGAGATMRTPFDSRPHQGRSRRGTMENDEPAANDGDDAGGGSADERVSVEMREMVATGGDGRESDEYSPASARNNDENTSNHYYNRPSGSPPPSSSLATEQRGSTHARSPVATRRRVNFTANIAARDAGDSDDAPFGPGSFTLSPGEAAPLRNLFEYPHTDNDGRRCRALEDPDDMDVPLVLPLHSTESGAAQPRRRRRRGTLFGSTTYVGMSFGAGRGGEQRDGSGGSSSASGKDSDGDTGSGGGDGDAGPAGEPSLAFANSVPRDVALGFAYFMEECNKAEDDAKDYGIHFLHVVVTKVNGAVCVHKDGYVSVDVPYGLTLAQSTVNDGNSSNRTSVAVKDVAVKAFLSRDAAFAGYRIPVAEAAEMGDHVEVFHLQTSLCARQFVAYPFDGSLAAHREKQRQFVEANDYEGLIRYAFFRDTQPPHQDATDPQHHTTTTTSDPPQPSSQQHQRQNEQTLASSTVRATKLKERDVSPDGPPTLPRPRRPTATPTIVHVDDIVSSSRRDIPGGRGDMAQSTGSPDITEHDLPIVNLAAELHAPMSDHGTTGTYRSPPSSQSTQSPISNGNAVSARPWLARRDSLGITAAAAAAAPATSAPPTTRNAVAEAAATAAELLSTDDDDSVDTAMAHSVDPFELTTSGLFHTSRSFDPATFKSDLYTAGAAFATCVSVSSSEFDSATDTDSSEMDGLLSTNRLRNMAFAADRVTSDEDEKAHRRRGGNHADDASSSDKGRAHQYWLREPVPVHRFFRTYFKEEPGDGNGATTLDYRVPRRPTRSRPLRNRTHAFAPLPSVAFFQSEVAHCFPEFVTASVLAQQAEEDGRHSTTTTRGSVLAGEGDTPSGRVPFTWALRTADNRERSRRGATTKHFHVETVEPVTALVSRMAADLAIAGAATFLQASTTHERERVRRGLQGDSTLLLSQKQGSGVKGGQRPWQSKAAFGKPNPAKKSRVRERQKRWLSENTIVSLLVPCVEVKLLMALPVPVENLPNPRKPMEGVYCSTLTIRDIHFYLWQNHPPAGVEVAVDAARRTSASLRVSTLSVVTQIEHEPFRREGNLQVRVPGVYYDAGKDTIGVVFLHNVLGSGKQDVVRGAEGGACRVSVHTVSVTVTRDFVDYCFALNDQALELRDAVARGLTPSGDEAATDSGTLSPVSVSVGWPRAQAGRPGVADGAGERQWRPLGVGAELGGARAPTVVPRFARGRTEEQQQTGKPSPLLSLGLDRGQTVQGKGFIKSIVVCVIDTRKQGRHIKVDLLSATTLEIAKANASFIVMTPHRIRDRDVQLQCVGEVDLVRATLFPSLLHVAHNRADQPAPTDDSPTGRSVNMPSAPSSPTTTWQPTLSSQTKNSNRVTFSEENPLGGAATRSPPAATSGGSAAATTPSAAGRRTPSRSPTVSSPPTKPSGGDGEAIRQTSGTSTTGSSQGPPVLSRQSTARGGESGVDTGSRGTAAPSPKPSLFESLSLVYNGSFTLRTLDVSMMCSESNYVQLKGKHLMGCAESRAEKVSSRECIQMEALAEVISEPMRERLRSKARAARERASRSRYAAPPSTTEQQQLKASACFFTDSILVHYVADPVIGGSVDGGGVPWGNSSSGRDGGEGSGYSSVNGGEGYGARQPPKLTAAQRKQRVLDSQVLVAVVSDVALSSQSTSQYDIAGEQTNVAVHVGKTVCDSPYRPNAGEVIHPQIHRFLMAWRLAVKGLERSRKANGSGWRPGSPRSSAAPSSSSPPQQHASGRDHTRAGGEHSSPKPSGHCNKAFFLVVQTKTIEAVVSLPQHVTQRFILPELSAFVQSSSDERVSAKVHVHPFTITSKMSDEEPDDGLLNYTVTLPSVFLMYAHDPIKVMGTVMVETVAITVTPLFINHTLLTYEKLTSDVFAVFTNAPPLPRDGGARESPTSSPLMGRNGPSSSSFASSPVTGLPAAAAECESPRQSPSQPSQPPQYSRRKVAKRHSFLFLLHGVRISYLTSVTNLRFTVRGINATADSAEDVAQRSLQWVIHVTNAQVALVDRHDHDQMVATVDSVMRRDQDTSSAFPKAQIDAYGEGKGGYLGSATSARGSGGPYHSRYRAGMPAVSDGRRDGANGKAKPPTAAAAAAGTSAPMPGQGGASAGGDRAGIADDEAHKLRAVHPPSGFIWGSAELSFTLSSGKMEHDEAKTALQENASFASYSADLQKALLNSLGHSSSQWELSIHSPLVILRFGLEDLLKMCFDETRDDIGRMKSAAAKENETFRMRLTRHKTFHKLQNEKRRYEALLRRTEKEQMNQLRRMTAQVASEVTHRRGGLALDDEETKMILDYFNTTKENRFVAVISHVLVVVPFGDAAFRSVLEELADTYSCGKQHRHIHTASCLNRRKFIPTLALKMRVEETSLLCALESVKRYVPVLRQAGIALPESTGWREGDADADNGGDGGGGGTRNSGSVAQTAEADFVSSHSLCGRFVMSNIYAYFTDGSPVQEGVSLHDLVADTNILGGRGILTEYVIGEPRGSRNTLYIACIDSPIHVERKDSAMRIGAVLDLTGPRVRLSSRLVNILSELAMEAPAEQLVRNFHTRHYLRKDSGDTSGHTATRESGPSASLSEQPRKKERPRGQGDDAAPSPLVADSYEKPRVHIDVSARLAAGTVNIYAYTKASALTQPAQGPLQSPTLTESRFLRSTGSTVTRRRVAFESRSSGGGGGDYPASIPRAGRQYRGAGAPQNVSPPSSSARSPSLLAQGEESMESLLSIPLPSVITQLVMDRGGPATEEDVTVAKVEVRAGTIELSPSITSLAKEIEEWAYVYEQFQQERRKTILAAVHGLEKEVATLRVPLHSTLEDVLLPLPWTLCNVLSTVRMRGAVQLRRSTANTTTGSDREAGGGDGQDPWRQGKTGSATAANSADEAALGDSHLDDADLLITEAKKVSKSFSGIHFTLTSFRLILTTEPIASTAFTVFLDDKSSIDLLVKVFTRPSTESRHFLNRFPDVSAVLSAHSLRAECQTKLEVKSLEVSLPEAELTVSKRQGMGGTVMAIAANFPLNGNGTEPNVVLRAQHLSQVVTVVNLWTVTLKDTLRSVRRLTARGTPADAAAQRVKETPLGQRMKSTTATLKNAASASVVQSERVLVALCVSQGILRLDLGSGNTHQLFFGEGHFGMESAQHDNGSHLILFLLTLSSISVRSEGVLGGIASIGSAFVQFFVLRNREGGVDFVRSPEGRTFREALAVRNVTVAFKERQLRDIFECKIDHFGGNSMDGVGEEGYTTTDLDVTLSRGTLGVTPSTAPAFLNFVRTVSALVADQHRVAMRKLKGAAPHLYESVGGTGGGGVDGSDGNGAARTTTTTTTTTSQTPFGDGALSSRVAAAARPFNGSSDGGNTSDHSRPPSSSGSEDGDAEGAGRSRGGRAAGFIPFMGNKLLRVPCGQLRFTVEETTLMLGSTSSSPDTAMESSVVVSLPKARLSFAECPCDDYTAAKKVLVLETHGVELYRPGQTRVVIMGFKGVNVFDFYTRQVLGDRNVGFTLSLRQTHPWTGNPRFRDFEDMVLLIRSFTDKKNATVFQRFGQMDDEEFPMMTAAMMMSPMGDGGGGVGTSATPRSRGGTQSDFAVAEAGTPTHPYTLSGVGGSSPTSPSPALAGRANRHERADLDRVDSANAEPLLHVAHNAQLDARQLRPLRSTKFSPQLRFGGDVSVNTEVILNWLGITEKMLPNVVNAQLCDKLEGVLDALASVASERVIPEKAAKKTKKRKPASQTDAK